MSIFPGKYLLVLAAIVIIVGAALVWAREPELTLASFEACFRNREDKRECAEKHARALLDTMPAADLVLEIEKQYPAICHAAGHFIGQELFQRSSVEEALLSCAPLSCWAACPHGVIGAAFVVDADIQISEEEWQHPNIDLMRSVAGELCTGRVTCHAVGHVLFTLSDSLTQALSLCEELSTNIGIGSCYHGVFMENGSSYFADVTLAGNRKSYRDPEDLLAPCSSLPEKYDAYCYWLHFLNQNIVFTEQEIYDEGERMQLRKEACETLVMDTRRVSCFMGFGVSLPAEITLPDALRVCGELNGKERASCSLGASHRRSSMGMPSEEVTASCDSLSGDMQSGCYEGYFRWLVLSNSELAHACDDATDSCRQALDAFKADRSSFFRIEKEL